MSTQQQWVSPQLSYGIYANPQKLGRLAIASLHAELVCAPKPGLVTPFDCGSHRDMNAATFMRSLFALRGYFVEIGRAAMEGAGFPELKRLGVDAQAAMLRATGGVNTHRGAIFGLGLLVAAAATLQAQSTACPGGEAICREVSRRWETELLAVPLEPKSHGQRAARIYGAGGARIEAALGFPSLQEIALPALRACLRRGVERNAALAHALMSLIAKIEDTNLLYRGGSEGLAFAQSSARAFLTEGGACTADWETRLSKVAAEFMSRNLSPGGSADLLACAWFLISLEQDTP